MPALLCSLVHMTGDPSWIRERALPAGRDLARVPVRTRRGRAGRDLRRRALPAIAAYRDGGCEPHPLCPRAAARDDVVPRRARPSPTGIVPMFFEDLQFDGADRRAITWGDEIPDDVKAAAPGRRDRLRRGGHPRRHPPRRRPACRSRSSRRTTARAAPGGRTGTRAPGSTSAATSTATRSSPRDHWSEYYCQQPELRDYFAEVLDKYGLGPHCRFGTTVTRADVGRGRRLVARRRPRPRTASTRSSTPRFVISAVGSLNIPRLPDIPGMDTFAGPSFHSARWPDDLDIVGHAVRARRRRRERLPDRPDDRRRGRRS